ncbi:MAG TPA: hypothetical protein VJQ77_11420 [Novosphingobium sp.]|nr:hypothetical protein [Novosphingobium sp.]
MIAGRRRPAIRLTKFAFVGVVAFFVLLTVTSLADNLLQAGWGLGWKSFFIGFIASAWGVVSYQLCASCFGWTGERR